MIRTKRKLPIVSLRMIQLHSIRMSSEMIPLDRWFNPQSDPFLFLLPRHRNPIHGKTGVHSPFYALSIFSITLIDILFRVRWINHNFNLILHFFRSSRRRAEILWYRRCYGWTSSDCFHRYFHCYFSHLWISRRSVRDRFIPSLIPSIINQIQS